MDLRVRCTGECRAVRGNANVATYGFYIVCRSRLLHRERGVVCVGQSATPTVAGLGAVLRALRWLLTADSIDRIEILTDCQEVSAAVQGVSGKVPYGQIALTAAVASHVQVLRRRSIQVAVRLLERKRLYDVEQMASRAWSEYLRFNLWPRPGSSPAPLMSFLRRKTGAEPGEDSPGLVIICDGGYRRVGSDPGVVAFAWDASQSARPLDQGSGAMLSRSKAGSLMAEYKAVVAALRWLNGAEYIPSAWVEIRSDCAAVIDRLLGRCSVRSIAGIDALHQTAEELRSALKARGCEVHFWHVPRNFVRDADRLCRRAYGAGVNLITGPADAGEPLGDWILPYLGGYRNSTYTLNPIDKDRA